MLTSSHYLLGGFLASTCAIGALLHPAMPHASDPAAEFLDPYGSETIDISYRGSGRLEGDPEQPDLNQQSSAQGDYSDELSSQDDSSSLERASSDPTSSNSASRGKDLVSHRGSGRVRPSLL
ncbi:MAG: hypothetical protein AAFO84_02510 [Cyanobacteria bacterium J06598_1]